ncbi:MAG: hypothetical protein AAF547_23670 [Actinomycetota bacterium]
MGFTSARTITASANPPRSAFVDLPLGHTTGGPNDPDGQRRILIDGLTAAEAMVEPGTIADLGYRWRDDDWKADPLSWSRRRQEAGRSGQAAGDTRTDRSPEPVYQTEADRATAARVSADEQCLVCLGLSAD